MRRDFEAAAQILPTIPQAIPPPYLPCISPTSHPYLPTIPQDQHNRIARFLETQGFKDEALAVATDPEHQFELAVQLGKLQVAYDITMANP